MFVSYEKRQCVVCKDWFKPNSSNQKYCSPECHKKAKREKAKVYSHRGYLKKKQDKEYWQMKKHLRHIYQTCARKHDNCFSCPYEDCIQE